MRFTSNRAIMICSKKLRDNYSRPLTNRDCYYHDGRCELGFNCENKTHGECIDFVDDVSFTNLVREKILSDPLWCEHNWEQMCRVDKELFEAIYGVSGKVII